MPSLEQELADVFQCHDNCWQQLAFSELAALWDASSEPIYIGEEYSQPLVGWLDLNKHWGRLEARLVEAEFMSQLQIAKPLGERQALSIVFSQWRLLAIGSDKANSGQSWVTAILTRIDNTWKFIHYAESPVFIDEGKHGAD